MDRILGFIIGLIAPFYEKWFVFKYHYGGYVRKKYYESRLKKCGIGLVVNGKPLLFSLSQISLGDHVTINDGVQIAPRGKVVIDDYVVLSRGAQITAGQLDTSKWLWGGIRMHLTLDLMFI